jgi:hypothetical protein
VLGKSNSRRILIFAVAATALGGVAMAQEVGAPESDPTSEANEFSVSPFAGARYITPVVGPRQGAPRQLELAFAAGGAPLDFTLAQRASMDANAEGTATRQSHTSEARLGLGLVDRRGSARSDSSTYIFLASDNEALTWQPGSRGEFGGQGAALALEDHVEIGDVSAGVTFERNGVQASLAYVEREASAHVGRESFSQDENFAGVTLTLRR